MAGSAPENLRNYLALIAKVDDLCQRTTARFQDEIACRRGCAGCCQHISVFPVEARAMATALANLPNTDAEHIRDRARGAGADAPCPLLEDGICLLYAARPLICRTHGLPVLTRQAGAPSVDFCPENFRGIATLPGNAVLDLDRLNETLAAINALFIAEVRNEGTTPPERLTIAAALRGA